MKKYDFKLVTQRVSALLLVLLVVGTIVHYAWAAPKRKYNRVKLSPAAEKADDVFFKDVFSQGLVGQRPATLGTGGTPVAPTGGGGNTPAGGNNSPMGGGKGWQEIVSAQTIEDEIKSLKLEVDKDVTTPSAFNGLGHKKCRKNFSVLAMLFAIIGEYSGDVRFSESAPDARELFARAAKNCKTGTTASYNEAKLRKADLGDLLRGSALNAAKEASPQADWSQVADRSQLMKRIDAAQKKLRTLTSSQGEFEGNAQDVVHEAEMLAAIAEAMTQEGMPDADDDGYTEYCETMKNSALEIINNVKLKNLDGATSAMGPITRSCDDCHELYRG